MIAQEAISCQFFLGIVTIAVFFIATAMTPAVIASAAQNASHTPVMPKSAAITSAQSTIAATPRRMDVIIAHFAAPTALK